MFIMRNTSKYPPGIFVMFFLQLLTMIGFSMIYALLVLYCTQRLHFTDEKTYALNAAYNALVFAIPVIGGYIADRFLGNRPTVVLSSVFSLIGLLLLMIQNVVGLYSGLCFFAIGVGFMVPCQYVLLGRLYPHGAPGRDSGFTIVYIGMNLGSLAASSVAGYIASTYGYPYAFLIGAIFMFFSTVLFLNYYNLYRRRDDEHQAERIAYTKKSRSIGLIATLICIPSVWILLENATLCNIILIAGSILCAAFIVLYAVRLGGDKRNKLLAFLILTIVSVAFWSLYQLGPSVMIIFMERNVDRSVFGHLIPAATLTSLNSFFIITIGPLLTWVWMFLGHRGKDFSVPTKFATGVILMGIGYIVLWVGIHFHNTLGFVALSWIVLSYFFQTVGELFVGPIGYSMVGSLVPKQVEGLMLGIWQLAAGIAGSISEFLAKQTATPEHVINPVVTDPIYQHAFYQFGMVTIIIGLLACLIIPYLKKVIGTTEMIRGH
ncbi:MAG: peptide MFS transporter [Legionellales bacterium]|nr:peptide MFS transporter [Legionellales bacterium]